MRGFSNIGGLVLLATAVTIANAATAHEFGIGAPDLSAVGGTAESAGAAVCNNDVPAVAPGGGALERDKLTALYAMTEYNTKTCAARGIGSWRVGAQQLCGGKNCGDVVFGVVRNLPLASGNCPGHTYNFAAICYRWTSQNNHKIKDRLSATWRPPSLPNRAFRFPVDVPIVYPDNETTAFDGWDSDGAGMWRQAVSSTTDRAFDWSSNDVQEADPGTGSRSDDTCWCKGSIAPPYYRITGGLWSVNRIGLWGHDHVGWFNRAVDYYRKKRRAPCGTTFAQQMQFKAVKVSSIWKDYGPVNTLKLSFDYTKVTSQRAGKSKTRVYLPVPTQARLACNTIAWPDPAQSAIGEAVAGAERSVNDPRPVAAAIDELEQWAKIAITYEDPPVLEASRAAPMVRGTGGDRRLLAPKGGRLSFRLPATASRPDVVAALRELVASYNAKDGDARFAVATAAMIHVAPARGAAADIPLLDTKVSFTARPRSALEALEELCKAVATARGKSVVLMSAPTNALAQRTIEFGAQDDPARTVIERLAAEVGLPLTWRLLRDPGTDEFALNVALVR